MERREPPGGGQIKDADETAKNLSSSRPGSRQENGRASAGTNSGRRDDRDRDRGTIESSGKRNRRASRRISGVQKPGRNSVDKKMRNSIRQDRRIRKLAGVSETSKPISRRSVTQRMTRASVNPNRCRGMRKTEIKAVPDIPKRVFKALHLLRHEKFLRVASRYIKPRKVAKKC